VSVADFEERAGRVHGNIERRAGDEVLVIEIACHNPRRRAVEAARTFRRRVAHAAEKRDAVESRCRREFRHHPLFIQRNDFHFCVRIIVGQIPAARAERVVGVRNSEPYGQNFDFEHIANFRAFDVNRPGENVSARALVLHLLR